MITPSAGSSFQRAASHPHTVCGPPPHHPARHLGAKGYQRYLREQRDKERECKRKMEERRAAFKRRKLFATLCESSRREAALKYVPLENKFNRTNKALSDYKGDFDLEHLDPL